jgi:abortive infection bacteriophage resistance protein
MCTEIMYLSHISMIFQNLKHRNDSVSISKIYNLPENIFASWIHTINYVRNIFAHYSRLWNKEFQIVPMFFETSKHKWINNPGTAQRGRIYYFICMLIYILDSIDEAHIFREKIHCLLDENPKKYQSFMGFPNDWENDLFWK